MRGGAQVQSSASGNDLPTGTKDETSVELPLPSSNVKRILANDYGEIMETKWNKYGDQPMRAADD
jgi:hypothetical protein